ncbi:MAG: mannose-6-phosphate isomerase, class I [Spirochaetales bacterium]|nr:mannose-6-phosphate isomerase, class I [Spirochaetales bacterium]
MAGVFLLQNTIQEYAWGSRSSIPELLGQPAPAARPQAELWMGAHPKAPSRVILEEGKHPVELTLSELIARDPEGMLGPSVAARFGAALPFLFKVLAAARPLSIQAHPDREQARRGFRRENEQGIPLDDHRRNYRDDNHKPEVICALTPFWALNGFRPVAQMIDLLQAAELTGIGGQVSALAASPDSAGLKSFFAAVMRLQQRDRQQAIREALEWAGRNPTADTARWILRLAELHPGDIGVLSPLLLNLIRLQPGQAMFLEAGVLHAYLEGTGIELMANSDNVIRGGLTSKHVDVEELLAILRFEGRAPQLVEAAETAPGQRVYQTPAAEFRLAEIRVEAHRPHRSPGSGSVELMIAVRGEGRIEAGASLDFGKGDSLLIPASTGGYRIHGSLHLFKAWVPL